MYTFRDNIIGATPPLPKIPANSKPATPLSTNTGPLQKQRPRSGTKPQQVNGTKTSKSVNLIVTCF